MEELEIYRGLTVDAARRLAKLEGHTIRVVREDGKDYALTMDLRERRINVIVEHGLVCDFQSFTDSTSGEIRYCF